MSAGQREWELLVLTADKNTQFAIEGLLERPEDLGIRKLGNRKIIDYPGRDPGVLRRAHDFLRNFVRRADYCIALFDREGCGSNQSREALEADLEQRLTQNGWQDRNAVVVLDPELEIWLWVDVSAVEEVVRWPRDKGALRDWMREHGLWEREARKPDRPKEAFEKVLAAKRTPRSSSLYRQLASRARFSYCTDPAFQKLSYCLRQWFPPAN